MHLQNWFDFLPAFILAVLTLAGFYTRYEKHKMFLLALTACLALFAAFIDGFPLWICRVGYVGLSILHVLPQDFFESMEKSASGILWTTSIFLVTLTGICWTTQGGDVTGFLFYVFVLALILGCVLVYLGITARQRHASRQQKPASN